MYMILVTVTDVFPARAGMIRSLNFQYVKLVSIPRESGDDPRASQ